MKKLLLTGTILLSVLAVKAGTCTKCKNTKEVKETPKIASVSEVPDKPKCNCHWRELLPLLKDTSFDAKLGTRTMKEAVSFPISENGEEISYTLDVNNEIILTSNKDKGAIFPVWKVEANGKTLDISNDDAINILKASEEK